MLCVFLTESYYDDRIYWENSYYASKIYYNISDTEGVTLECVVYRLFLTFHYCTFFVISILVMVNSNNTSWSTQFEKVFKNYVPKRMAYNNL